jgi:predicted ribosomally synthesized peptide with nif11-like leader
VKTKSGPLEFLEKVHSDPKLSQQVFAAIENGNKVTADEILRIARDSGYSFTQSQFEKAVTKAIAQRFASGDPVALAGRRLVTKLSDAPESACSRGCLSYTHNYHP